MLDDSAPGTAKKVWDFKKEREVNCFVHGSIEIYDPISCIIDTPVFQRLRYVKQLGTANYVYPSAAFSRFEHSLGVYHLSYTVAYHLYIQGRENISQREASGDRNMDVDLSFEPAEPNDVLCVAIAGLLHDLGHGPFSHTYDNCFLPCARPDFKWAHEDCSIEMFEYMLKTNPRTKERLDEYLTEQDYIFIAELIKPPKKFFDKSGEWVLKGRPRSKAYLYDIVSNVHDGLDVDKFDYFLRDSLHTGVSIAFSRERLKRIVDHARAKHVPALGHPRICYGRKVEDDLKAVAQSRPDLYRHVYKHKTVAAIEQQLIEILVEADPYLQFPSDDGKIYRMSNAMKDPSAYVKLNDSVLDMIRVSTDPNLKRAQLLLQKLERREIYPTIGTLTANDVKEAEERQKEIETLLEKNFDLVPSEFFVQIFTMHQGLGLKESPLKHLWFYNEKKPEKPVVKAPLNWRQLVNPEGGRVIIQVYLKMRPDKETRQRIEDAVEDYIQVRTENELSRNASSISDVMHENSEEVFSE